MIDKETKKKLNKIQKDIKRLKKEFEKSELRPCQCDDDLKHKDEDLKKIREKILALENEQDRYVLNTGGIRHGG